MKVDTALLIVALGLVVVLAVFTPAYASNLGANFEGEANTYNEGSSASMQNITVTLDSVQYSGAITNTVNYIRIEYDANDGRPILYSIGGNQ